MKNYTRTVFTLLFSAVALLVPLAHAGQMPTNPQLIAESSMLAGLAPNALFPFVDSTPHHKGTYCHYRRHLKLRGRSGGAVQYPDSCGRGGGITCECNDGCNQHWY